MMKCLCDTSKLFLPRLIHLKAGDVSGFIELSSFFLAIICPPTLLITTVSLGCIFGLGFFFLCGPNRVQPILFLMTYDGYDLWTNSRWFLVLAESLFESLFGSFSVLSLAILLLCFLRWFLFLLAVEELFLLFSFIADSKFSTWWSSPLFSSGFPFVLGLEWLSWGTMSPS